MIDIKLNDEQRKMVEDNHNLIYQYIHDKNLNLEEWYGWLAIELCESVLRYNPDKGKLSTLFYIRCNNKLRQEYRKKHSQKRCNNGVVPIIDDLVGEDVCIIDKVDNSIILDKLMEHEYADIIKLRCEGYTQNEIADIVGISQSNVSKILKKIKKEYLNQK